jgi:hypothetical protein
LVLISLHIILNTFFYSYLHFPIKKLPLPLILNLIGAMGVTRLKRKEKRNRAVAKARVAKIKHLTTVPVIKNVDVEEIKKSFAAPAKKSK